MSAAQKITEAQAGEYARTLFAGDNPLIWNIRRDFFVVTCWLENSQPYGEW